MRKGDGFKMVGEGENRIDVAFVFCSSLHTFGDDWVGEMKGVLLMAAFGAPVEDVLNATKTGLFWEYGIGK
jgi:hypothetical protein